MKKLRRILILITFISILICFLLLLNFTAPNPTGRRYSSEMPIITGQGESNEIGLSGELVLAKDLGLLRNEQEGQQQCFCNSSSAPDANRCKVCVAHSDLIADYRIPDFIGSNFIAESKNRLNLYYTGREVDELPDYALAARLMNYTLWVYVRVDTPVSPKFIEIAESTGGGVVYYFTVPGYSDPVDQAAKKGLLITLPIFSLGSLWEIFSRRKSRIVIKPASKPPKSPPDPLRKADNAAEFAQRRKNRARTDIEIEDSRYE